MFFNNNNNNNDKNVFTLVYIRSLISIAHDLYQVIETNQEYTCEETLLHSDVLI